MKTGKNRQPLLLGTSQISKFQPNPLNDAPIQHEAARSGPCHSWGRQKVLRLTLKQDPSDLLPLAKRPLLVSPLIVSLLAKPQELPVTQLARHVNLFLLVVTDNQRPETLFLPHDLAPPIKPTTHSSQAASL
jgi:hypothetical protein